MGTLFKNGTIITASDTVQTDVLVEGEIWVGKFPNTLSIKVAFLNTLEGDNGFEACLKYCNLQ